MFIPDLGSGFYSVPDPGVKKARGPGSVTLITSKYFFMVTWIMFLEVFWHYAAFYFFPPSSTKTITHSSKFSKVIEACLKDSSTALDIIRGAELGFQPVLGSVKFWYGSEFSDPYLWLTDLDADPEGPKTYGSGFGTLVHLHHSSKKKIIKGYSRNLVFSY